MRRSQPRAADATLLRLDVEGRIASWPDAARDMFGRTRKATVGLPLCTLMEPADRCACASVVAELCRDRCEGVVKSMKLVAERGDGVPFHVQCSLWRSEQTASAPPAIEVLIRDIGDHAGLERELHELRTLSADQLQELRRTQSLFTDITEAIGEVFWMADPAISRMLYVSPAYERMWGRSCRSLYDDPKSFIDSIHPEDHDRVLKTLAAQRRGLPFDHEYRIVRPDGTVVWVWDRGFPVRNHYGEVDRYIGVAQDITARRVAEANVIRQQAIDAIGHMSGGLAHDFNNVLGVIVGHLDLLALAAPSGSDARDNIDRALDAALRGSRLARRLLALARREPLERRIMDLGDAVEALLPLLQHAAGAETRVEHEIDARPLVSVDAAELDGALVNMAVNARAAMAGGGVLTIHVSDIELVAHSEYALPPGRYAQLSVSDTGCGMDDAVLRRLGEPFFSTRRSGDGTGLGVAMIHAFARQSGGALHVRSAPGAGTTFTILLPVVTGGAVSDSGASARGTMPT